MGYWNLIELIRASGSAGAANQSFKTNVVGAAEGIKMTDYLITTPVWGNLPLNADQYPGGVSSFGTYQNNDLISPTLGLTRGAEAYRIQQKTSSAFIPTLSPIGSAFGHNAVVESVSTADNGGNFTINIRLTSAVSTGGMTAVAEAFGPLEAAFAPGSPSDLVQPVRWRAYPEGTASDTTTFNLYLQYDPDSAGFNPLLDQFGPPLNEGWKIRLANRVETVNDFDFEWYLDSSMTGTPFSTAATIQPAFGTTTNAYSYGYGPFLTYPNGSRPLEESRLWLRYRRKGSPTWLTHNNNPVSYYETRIAFP